MRFVSKMSLALLVGKVAAKRFLTWITSQIVVTSVGFAGMAMILVAFYALWAGGSREAFEFYGDIGALLIFASWVLDNVRLRLENSVLRRTNAYYARHIARPNDALEPAKKDNVIPFPAKGGDLNA